MRKICLLFLTLLLFISLEGKTNANAESNDVFESSSKKLTRLVAKHLCMNENSVRINEVRKIEKNRWFVLYKVKNNSEQWMPSEGSYGISVVKTSDGEFKLTSMRYGRPWANEDCSSNRVALHSTNRQHSLMKCKHGYNVTKQAKR